MLSEVRNLYIRQCDSPVHARRDLQQHAARRRQRELHTAVLDCGARRQGSGAEDGRHVQNAVGYAASLVEDGAGVDALNVGVELFVLSDLPAPFSYIGMLRDNFRSCTSFGHPTPFDSVRKENCRFITASGLACAPDKFSN